MRSKKKSAHSTDKTSWNELIGIFPFSFPFCTLILFFLAALFPLLRRRCCTTLAAQQQQKKSYIFTGRRTTTPERSEHFKPSNRYVNDDRPMMMMISTPTYISSLHWTQRVSGGKFHLSRYAELAGFFTFFSLCLPALLQFVLLLGRFSLFFQLRINSGNIS